ncbi:hypothetical protein [Corynebacterium variabile]|uniref:hypothetical protein n=1 Tax=Corynebacterium variabile TaxID=1727 RepID=UPI00264831E6|nr:hypothetical protein [Corynebacterium variabile]MDN6241734.1 hypothetical protein [Corynebacterium variabile]MDN6478554.1 hypothetical protein [Corynebacterium variabile]MDN6676889.1 hypothetical protein [Corynebacterium variabile]MDN6845490.1 hypothetical protein [Corynebacterium variabile]
MKTGINRRETITAFLHPQKQETDTPKYKYVTDEAFNELMEYQKLAAEIGSKNTGMVRARYRQDPALRGTPEEFIIMHKGRPFQITNIPQEEKDTIRSGKYTPDMGAMIYDSGLIKSQAAFALRGDAPAILYSHATSGFVTPVELKYMLSGVYRFAKMPSRKLPRNLWIYMFRKAGFGDYMHLKDPAPDTITLYRGTQPAGKAGMSWTQSRTLADAYAVRANGYQPGTVYTTQAPKESILAHYPCHYFGDEWVIDTDGLNIEECGAVTTMSEYRPGEQP